MGDPHISTRNVAEIVTYWLSGNEEALNQSVRRARDHIDRSRSPDGSFEHEDLVVDVGLLEAIAGNTEVAEKYVYEGLRVMQADPAAYTSFSHYGCRTFAIANAVESAVDCLRRVLTEPSSAVGFLEPRMPEYDSIRDEPAFIELLGEIEDSP